MSIIRYAVKTKSGSWYLIEDESHIMRRPTWRLITSQGKYHIVGLLPDQNIKGGIPIENVRSLNDFRNCCIYYSEHPHGPFNVQAPHTSPIVEYIQLK